MPPKTWTETLLPLLGTMRAELGQQDIETVAALTGAELQANDSISLKFWDDIWLIHFPDAAIVGISGQQISPTSR